MTETIFGKNWFGLAFEFLVSAEVRPEIMEEGFMSCRAAHHQGAIKTFWHQFWGPLQLSIFLIYSLWSATDLLLLYFSSCGIRCFFSWFHCGCQDSVSNIATTDCPKQRQKQSDSPLKSWWEGETHINKVTDFDTTQEHFLVSPSFAFLISRVLFLSFFSFFLFAG